MNKGLTIKTGQTHVQAYMKPLLEKIEAGAIEPSFVITHPAKLKDAPEMYQKFRDKEDGVIKVVLRPAGSRLHEPCGKVEVALERFLIVRFEMFLALNFPAGWRVAPYLSRYCEILQNGVSHVPPRQTAHVYGPSR